MKKIITERINCVIFEDDPETQPSPKDSNTKLYLVRPRLTTDDVIVARYDREARKFRDGNMLFHGALYKVAAALGASQG